jgi:tripartite-type tricarboxylate transporter receptor subunit TctC
MKIPRRQFLRLAAGAAALPVAPRTARAQTYPTRPVRLIVGFAPGGPTDLLARLMAQWLTNRLGQPFIIENRPGAGSNIATQAVINSPPDGSSLIMLTPANAINATLYEKIPFDLLSDIAPVAGFVQVANVVEVHPSLPITSIAELIAYGGHRPRAHPLPGSWAGADGFDRRAGQADVRQYAVVA